MAIAISCILTAVLVGIDQWTKALAVEHLAGNTGVTVIPGLLDFVYVENYGAAFGILQNKTLFFLILTGACILAFIVGLFLYKKHTWLTYTFFTLIIAGGIGNIIDRFLHAYVVDFIQVSFFPPVFNFADCCAVVGTVLLCYYAIFCMDKKNEPAALNEQEPTDHE